MTLTEKVAEAIDRAGLEWDAVQYRASFGGGVASSMTRAATQARAAIAVVLEAMREPSEDMMRAGDAAVNTALDQSDDATLSFRWPARQAWAFMLAAFTRTALDADTGA